MFAPLVPVERVWVEQLGPADAPVGVGTDVVSRLVSLDAPAPRRPVPADLVVEDGVDVHHEVVLGDDRLWVERHDLRAVTEPHTNADGDICVRVTTEVDWYRWAWSGRSPRTREVPVHLLWVD